MRSTCKFARTQNIQQGIVKYMPNLEIGLVLRVGSYIVKLFKLNTNRVHQESNEILKFDGLFF